MKDLLDAPVRGYHLVADGMGVSCHPGDIASFVEEAVHLTGLHPIAPAAVNEARGIGFVMIAESHISVHVYGERAFVDCFSCRPFRWAGVVSAAQKVFGGVWRTRYFKRSVPAAPPNAGGSSAPAKGSGGSWLSRVLGRGGGG